MAQLEGPIAPGEGPAVGRLAGLDALSVQANPGVDDAGLAHLRGLAALTSLDLRGTRATPAGATALHRSSPRAEVYLDGPVQLLPALGTPAR